MTKISGQFLISGQFQDNFKFQEYQEFQDNWEPWILRSVLN